MDAETAFLNSFMDKNVYLEQFEGYEAAGRPRSEWVLRLKKAIYGLKQSPLLWYKTLKAALVSLGYTPLSGCACVFFKYATSGRNPASQKQSVDSLVILMVFVDDVAILTKDPNTMDTAKHELHSKFKFTDQGRVRNHLGLVYDYDFDSPVRTLKCSNVSYIDKMLERFELEYCHPVATPYAPNARTQDSAPFPHLLLYQEAVGALMWAAVSWRWDIATAVGLVARKVSAPTYADWHVVKRIFRYLKGTRSFDLQFTSTLNDPSGLRVYSDADYAGDPTDRKSTSGILALWNGFPILWKSGKQPCVAQSTTEAEYIAAAIGSNEAIWLRQLLADILEQSHGFQPAPTPLHVDNQSAIALASSGAVNNRTKHIDVRYHAIRDAKAHMKIDIVDTPTEDQLADFFTKPFAPEKHKRWIATLTEGAIPGVGRVRPTQA